MELFTICNEVYWGPMVKTDRSFCPMVRSADSSKVAKAGRR